MEWYKQPDIWYRFDHVHIKLSSLTDAELHHRREVHVNRVTQINAEADAALSAIDQELHERGVMDQQVLKFFGSVAAEVGHDN